MRYVMKGSDDNFVSWIQWTAGIVPLIRLDNFEKAMIVDDDYFAFEIEKINKTRRESIQEKYPDIKFVQVEITIKN